MADLVARRTSQSLAPAFRGPVITDPDLFECFCDLHGLIMSKAKRLEKETALKSLVSQLLSKEKDPASTGVLHFQSQSGWGLEKQGISSQEVKKAVRFIGQNYFHPISLDQLCQTTFLSKSTLLRAFHQNFGLSPYRYLATIRIQQAKQQLEQGISCAAVAAEMGYADQSYFSGCFLQLTGLTPSLYQQGYQQMEREKHDERKE